MDLLTKKQGDYVVVYLSGRMDVHLSAEIETQLNQIIKANPDESLILDLGKVEYMSSSGLRIFVATMRQLKETGRKLKLCNLTQAVLKVFEVVELMDMFEVYQNLGAALDSK